MSDMPRMRRRMMSQGDIGRGEFAQTGFGEKGRQVRDPTRGKSTRRGRRKNAR